MTTERDDFEERLSRLRPAAMDAQHRHATLARAALQPHTRRRSSRETRRVYAAAAAVLVLAGVRGIAAASLDVSVQTGTHHATLQAENWARYVQALHASVHARGADMPWERTSPPAQPPADPERQETSRGAREHTWA